MNYGRFKNLLRYLLSQSHVYSFISFEFDPILLLTMAVTVKHVLQAAQPMMGRARKGRDGEFESFFGVNVIVATAAWNLCDWPDDIKLLHMLWALLFSRYMQPQGS